MNVATSYGDEPLTSVNREELNFSYKQIKERWRLEILVIGCEWLAQKLNGLKEWIWSISLNQKCRFASTFESNSSFVILSVGDPDQSKPKRTRGTKFDM